MFVRSSLLLRTKESVYLCRVILYWSVRLLRIARVASSGVSRSEIVDVSALRCCQRVFNAVGVSDCSLFYSCYSVFRDVAYCLRLAMRCCSMLSTIS